MPETKWYEGARRVFVFPRLGVVIKLPIIYWRKGWNNLVHWTKNGGIRLALSWTEDQLGGTRSLWTKGLRDNWNEYTFYLSHRTPFLQPTLFSLFGLVNIQEYGEILDEEKAEGVDLWGQFFDLTKGESHGDGHHFSNSTNFCVKDGRLRIVDYGSPATREILSKWADVLYERVTLEPKPVNKG